MSIVKLQVLTRHVEAHLGLFRLIMKGKFNPYVL